MIEGNGKTIDGNQKFRIFVVAETAALAVKKTTLTRAVGTNSECAGEDGGAICSRGFLLIVESAFTNNSSNDDGGAIANFGAAEIRDSDFSNNSARDQAGAIFNNGSATLMVNDSDFNNNRANAGGAIYNHGTITQSGNIFSNNRPNNCYQVSGC